MACVSHNREHRQKAPTMPICKGHHACGVLTCHKAQMLNREALVQCCPPTIPSIYVIVTGTTKVGGKGGKGDVMCQWMGM